MGAQYGHLEVIGITKAGKHAVVKARCVCGTTKNYRQDSLKSGNTKSCGCMGRAARSAAAKQRKAGSRPATYPETVTNSAVGESNTPLYAVWRTMIARCYNPKHNRFHVYGARGVSVDPAWHDFVGFRDWATSHGYSKKLTIDRIDSDGPYSPSNCRWVDQKTQQNRRRNNVVLEAFGEKKTLAEWAADPRCVPSYKMLHQRYKQWRDLELALTAPLTPGRKPVR
jgi:hypothetical protein